MIRTRAGAGATSLTRGIEAAARPDEKTGNGGAAADGNDRPILVLHLTATLQGGLALWGEQLVAAGRQWQFATDEALRGAVKALFLEEGPPATPSLPDLPIMWPGRRLDPCPSRTLLPFLLSGDADASAFEPDRLIKTRVAALQTPALVAHRLVSREKPSWVHLAPDAAIWALMAGDALALVASGRFVPRLVAASEGAAFRWTPLVEYGAELARLAELALALPDAARAANPDVAPAALAGDVLTRMVDGLVRQLGSPGRREPALHGSSLQAFRLLSRSGPEMILPPGIVQQLGAAGLDSSLPGRVMFRVVPASEGLWTIEFLLQDRRDPSVLVQAEAVWRREGTVIHHFGQYGADAEELLLRGLARAARVSAVVARVLEEKAPSGVACTVAEAYEFLRVDAPHLELLGFGMLLPAWWQRRGARARLGVRGRVRTGAPKTGGAVTLSADSLVKFDWQVAVGDVLLSRNELSRLAELKQPLVQIRGQWVEISPEMLEQAVILMQREQEMPLIQAMMQSSPADGMPLLGIEGEDDLGPVIDQLQSHTPLQPAGIPELFVGELRSYQRRGLDWLAFLSRYGLGGCLADDMGLGKTIQTIALILHRRETGHPATTLLVCPTSVVSNWLRELQRFAPSLRCAALQASAETRKMRRLTLENDVLIASYGLVARNIKPFSAIEWDGVVLDEATNVKNLETGRAQAVRKLHGAYRLALTGTPVENRLSELHSILTFANPGFLGSERSFRERFATPIEKWNDQERAEELQRIVQPFILRRTKADPEVAADLPTKREAEIVCSLTAEQASLYQATVDDMLARIDAVEGMERRGLVLSTISKLKQICNHPANFLKDASSLSGRSGKLARLEEMLGEIAEVGERALIFTQFAEFGGRLATYLQQTTGLPTPFYHGGLSARSRDRIVDAFQALEGPGALLVSIRAGGVGLNLTAANHVFHYDRWWNPAVEDQATDRAFRFGQTRDVMVYKFITNGTIETHIADMIAAKRKLAGLVVRSGEGWLTELSTSDLREILTLDRDLALAA